jgi:para-nitrobenzyl esterase
MVWIHGGALVTGESNEYNPIKLVRHGVVVVTINYRLGVLGFLAHPALTSESPDQISGNYAIGDQQAALKWVRRNIRRFGGDPENVTILAHQNPTPAPHVDGKILTQSIGAALGSGQFNRVPLMNGTNHDEGNSLLPGPVTASTYETAIGTTIGTPAAPPLVAAHYQVPAQFPSFDQAVGAVETDAAFACPARFADELASPFVRTFAYEFSDEKAPQNYFPPVSFPYGAAHTSEIQYIFPVANPTGLGLNLATTPLDSEQQKLSDRMVGYWTEFARSGDPNGHGQPSWPRVHRDRQVMLSLVEPSPTPETNFATAHQCDFWDTLAGRTLPPEQSAENQ